MAMSKILLIYDEIGMWGTTAKDVAQFLIDNKGEAIDVHINSPGGDVFDAYAIYNNLKNTPNCTIYIDGIAASAAAVIALCGKPLKMATNTQLMLHSASCGAFGNKKEMEERIAFLDDIDTNLASMIASKLGKDVEEIKNTYFDGVDHWLSAKECQEMGICEVYEPSVEDKARLQKITACLRQNINNKTNDMLKKFQAVDAFKGCETEEDVLGKVSNLIAESFKKSERIAELEATEQKYNDLMAQLVAEQKEADNAIIEDAIKDGRITDENKQMYVDLMEQNRELAHKIINSLVVKPAEAKPIKKVEDFIKEDGVKLASNSWEARMKEISDKTKR